MKENLIKRKRLLIAILVFVTIVSAIVIFYPKITIKQELYTVEAGEQLSDDVRTYADFASGFFAKKATVNTDLIDADSVGRYECFIVFNNKEYPFTVEVVDTTSPTCALKEGILSVVQGTELKAKELIENIQDMSEVKVSFVDDKGQESDTYVCDEKGAFALTIKLTDAYGNKTEIIQNLAVVISDTTAPVISGMKDITVYVGETPNYLKDVIAEDETDGDVTTQIIVDSSKVDVDKKGTYKVTYSCKDKAGNEAVENIVVTVKKKDVQTITKVETQQTVQNTLRQDSVSSNSSGNSKNSGNQSTSASQPEKKPESTPAPQPEKKPEPAPAPQPEKKPEPAPQPDLDDSTENFGPDQVDPGDRNIMTPEEYDEMVENSKVGCN